MGKVTRKRYTADFKAKVALEAIKGELTLAELASKRVGRLMALMGLSPMATPSAMAA